MIAIVDYGMGNLKSIEKACRVSCQQEIIITDRVETVTKADKVILPGVGAFGNAIRALKQDGMDRALKDCAAQNKPLLGICLGYQLLFDKSFEDGEYQGLGLIRGEVRPLCAPGLKIPHMGWNTLRFAKTSVLAEKLSDAPWMYFVHSYAAKSVNEEDILAVTDYGGQVIAAVQKNNIFGCQFHPEKSGDVGLRLLKNFLSL